MNEKIYYLSTCTTCNRIIKELNLKELDFEFQDIKFESITEDQLSLMHELSGSYESLFSITAHKYNTLGLKEKKLNEADYKSLILDEYTFLKRPVIIISDSIFVGNSKQVIKAALKK